MFHKTTGITDNSYLWCQVLRSSTEGFHGSTVCDPLLTQPKVCYFDMAIFVQHEVLQLHTETNIKL